MSDPMFATLVNNIYSMASPRRLLREAAVARASFVGKCVKSRIEMMLSKLFDCPFVRTDALVYDFLRDMRDQFVAAEKYFDVVHAIDKLLAHQPPPAPISFGHDDVMVRLLSRHPTPAPISPEHSKALEAGRRWLKDTVTAAAALFEGVDPGPPVPPPRRQK